MSETTYDRIGIGYADTRRADPIFDDEVVRHPTGLDRWTDDRGPAK